MLGFLHRSKQTPTTPQTRTKEQCLQAISDIVERGKISISDLNKFVDLIQDENKLQTALMFL